MKLQTLRSLGGGADFIAMFHREAYFQRKAEERKKDKEQKRQATEAAAASAALEAATSKAVQTKGAVLYFKGPDITPTTSREDIKVGAPLHCKKKQMERVSETRCFAFL